MVETSYSGPENLHTPVSSLCCILCYQRIIFDFTTAAKWDFVAAVERLPALHYSVYLIFLSFEIMGFIVEL